MEMEFVRHEPCYDPDGKWNRFGLTPLREALHSNCWKQPALEQTAGEFLKTKFDTGDPLQMYTAFRISRVM